MGTVKERGQTDEIEWRLVRRAKQGDTGAFEGLYRRHAGRVFALCLRLSGNASTAEELTQEVFVRTWRKLSSFEGRSAFSSWLHRLAVNVALAAIRTKSRRVATTAADEEGANAPRQAGGGHAETRLDLEAAIASLPPGARTVFVLHDVEGYKHEEIASLVGMSEGTSKAHLHRARQLLREALGQ